jgi:phosphoglycolate phosphatase
MKSYDCAVFDFDGTLVDGLDAIVECSDLTFAKFDIKPPSKEEIRKRIGLPLHKIYRDFLPPDKHHQIDEVIEAYRLCAHKVLPKKTYLREGVIETLKYIKNQGTKIGIATTKATDTTVKTLEHLDALKYFDSVCGIDLVNHPKPDPEQLLLVIKMLGSVPERSVMIGDTYVDVQAARSAGVFSIAILDGYGERRLIDDAGPDIKIETISELIKSGFPFGRMP